MSNQLTKIQRFRFSVNTVEKLDTLSRYGVNKSKFVRDAVNEKLARELPELTKPKKQYCPF
jgi:predicted DNA-binding protein